jgi:hypothetical protein
MKQTKIPHLACLIISLSFCLSTLFFSSCGQTDAKSKKYNLISDFLKTKHHYILDDKIKTIFVITDNGCFSCNKQFAQLASEKIKNSNVLFIIIGSETNIDISLFPKSNANILFDNPEFVHEDIFKQSSIFRLKEHQIDTTIVISARELESQVELIKHSL